MLAVAGLVIVSGCSGRPRTVARSVTGKVTLGGQPLAGAQVMFMPVSAGSGSYGTTDENGEYELVWAAQRGRLIKGAQIGEHTVRISTLQEADPDNDPPVPAAEEKVPYKYRQPNGYPTATVKKGSNVINFDLEAGPVNPPQPKTKGKGKRITSECY